MIWKKSGALEVGDRCVEIRSLKVKDEFGRTHRLRACTVWQPGAVKFSATPATGRLFRAADGAIGVLVAGKNMGHVKVGKGALVANTVPAPLNCVSKKALRRLTGGTGIRLEEVDGVVVGFERGTRE